MEESKLVINGSEIELDCKKITTIEEIKLILDAFKISVNKDCKHYEKLKHLKK